MRPGQNRIPRNRAPLKMDEKKIVKELKGLLSPARFKHSLRVREKALQLSNLHGINAKKASVAGLLHDVARYMDRAHLLAFALKNNIKVDAVSRLEPKLLHAPISAYIARKRFKIKDPAVLEAIRCHTLGKKNMSLLDKVIYIADHTEEGRTHAGAKRSRELAKKDLNKAVVEVSSSMINYLLKKGLPVHSRTYEVRNYYLLVNDKKKQRSN